MGVAGIDGTKGGWVAIVLDDGRFAGDRLLPLETNFAELGDVNVVAIDVPIGFGPREADRAARVFLAGAASTVFTTPSEEVLQARFRPGLRVSAQARALGPRILHVTRLARSDERIREVHPEVSFRAMNELEPLRYRKRSGSERSPAPRRAPLGAPYFTIPATSCPRTVPFGYSLLWMLT